MRTVLQGYYSIDHCCCLEGQLTAQGLDVRLPAETSSPAGLACFEQMAQETLRTDVP